MALLTTQQIKITGDAVTLAAASAGGDTVTPGERTFLWVKNANGTTARTVTVVTPTTLNRFGQDLPSVAVNVPLSAERLIGPLPRALANPTTDVVDITYSTEADLTVAAVRT